MKVVNINLGVSDDFEPGQCEKCPLGSYVSSNGKSVCILSYRKDNCPIKSVYSNWNDEDDYEITD